jgi:hypothetical protein
MMLLKKLIATFFIDTSKAGASILFDILTRPPEEEDE